MNVSATTGRVAGLRNIPTTKNIQPTIVSVSETIEGLVDDQHTLFMKKKEEELSSLKLYTCKEGQHEVVCSV